MWGFAASLPQQASLMLGLTIEKLYELRGGMGGCYCFLIFWVFWFFGGL